MAWDQVCTPKSKGGLGLRRVKVMNKTLLCTWLWMFEREVSCIWRKVIVSRYGLLPNGEPCPIRGSYGCSPWKGIMKLFKDFKGGLRVVIRNGSKTRFWRDIWCDEQPLQRVYPLLFSLVSDPDALVHDYFDFGFNPPSWHPILRRQVFDWEVQDIVAFLGRLESVQLNID